MNRGITAKDGGGGRGLEAHSQKASTPTPWAPVNRQVERGSMEN